MPAYYRISVKREQHGAASQYRARPRRGPVTSSTVAAPRGTFILQPGAAPVLLISAGVGATPVLAMLHALADAAVRPRDVVAARRAQPGRATVRGRGDGHCWPSCPRRTGTSATVGRALTTCSGRDFDVGRPAVGGSAGRAGPAARGGGLSVRAGRIHDRRGGRAGRARSRRPARSTTEIFGARPALTPGIAAAAARAAAPPDGSPGTGPEVAFARSGLTARWDQRLREPAGACRSLRRAGALVLPYRRMPYLRVRPGIRGGRLRADPLDDPADGNVLICCSQPRGDVALDL